MSKAEINLMSKELKSMLKVEIDDLDNNKVC